MRSAAPTNTMDELADARRPGFAAVTAAFERFAEGDDAEAIAFLGAVALTSPLSPWKLMLRGLIAWRGGDDARARDNWRRLPAGGEPSRLIAPLLAEIDPAYRQSLPSAERATLRRRYQALIGVRLPGSLKVLLGQFGRSPPGQVIERARPLLAPLQRLLPDGPVRLTAALSLLLCDQGRPSDLQALAAHFPPPADDPRFDRLRALVAEGTEQLPEAIQAWRDYDATLAERPDIFGVEADRARAHIWCRIAERDLELVHAPRGAGSAEKPDPQASLSRALALAPDFVPALKLQFGIVVASGRLPAILKAGRELLRHDPHCDYTLATLAALCRINGQREEGIEFARRLYEDAPFNPTFNGFYTGDLRALARDRLRRGDPAGLAMLDRASKLNPAAAASHHAIRAAHASRAGNEVTAEEHIALAGSHPAEVALRLLGEAAYFDLPKLTKRFLPALRKSLAGAATVPMCHALTDALADQLFDHVGFPGRVEIEKRVQAKLVTAGKKAKAADLPALFRSARLAGWAETLAMLFLAIERKHPKDPRLPFEVACAYLAKGLNRQAIAGVHARKALARLQRLPPEERPADLAAQLEKLFGPLLCDRGPMDDLFDDFFGEAP